MEKTDPASRKIRVWTGRGHLGWWVLGVVLLGVLGLVVREYLPWLVFGLFVYYVARPVAARLERHIASRTLAAALTLALFVVPVVMMIGAILLVAIGQLARTAADIPVERIAAQLPIPVSDLPNTPTEVYDTTLVLIQEPSVQTVIGSIGGMIGAIGAVLFNLFIALLIAFFLLISARDIAVWFETNVFGEDSLAVDYLATVDRGLGSIYFGYTMTIFAVVLLTAMIYALFNLVAPGSLVIPSVVLFAVVTGLFTLVPLVGRSVVYFTIAAVLGAQAAATDPRLLWFPLVFLAIMIVGFDNLVRTYIRPYLSGRLLNTGLVMFAYLFGPPLFGWSGIFLGPFLMLFIVTFVRMILPVLAGTDRERVETDSEHTLDEYAENVANREGERPSGADRSDLGSESDPTA